MRADRFLITGGIVTAVVLTGLLQGRSEARFDRLATAGMARGSDDAPVTMVEFLDYECPFCQQFHTETMPKLIEEYVDTGRLRFVLRDNPLGFHENALPAARAVRCAGEQGDEAFWQLSDALVAAGAPLDAGRISAAAAEMNLNTGDLASCMSSGRYDAAIQADASAASEAGLTGTPMFIIGPSNGDGSIRGRVIRGAYPIETFRTAIDEALESASAS